MKASSLALKTIRDFEQLKLVAYQPVQGDKWTIGYGSTRGVKEGDIIDELEAESRLADDIADVDLRLNKLLAGVNVTQNQYDALASLCFNIGLSAFSKSTLLKKLQAGDFAGAAAEFPRWVYFKGTPLKGLVRRRAFEKKLFEG